MQRGYRLTLRFPGDPAPGARWHAARGGRAWNPNAQRPPSRKTAKHTLHPGTIRQ